jgi:hypothetical protein
MPCFDPFSDIADRNEISCDGTAYPKQVNNSRAIFGRAEWLIQDAVVGFKMTES